MLRFYLGNTAQMFSYNYTRLNPGIKQAFSVISMGDYLCDSQYFTQRDKTNQCLLIYTVGGEGRMEYNKKSLALLPGSVVIINCNRYHLYKTGNCGEWHFLWIHFDGDSAFSLVDSINENGLFMGNIQTEEFLKEFEGIRRVLDDGYKNAELEASLAVHKLLAAAATMKLRGVRLKYSGFRGNIDNTIFYIKQNYSRKISLNELAKISLISKYYYIQIFKYFVGVTPYRYLLNVRINESKALLKYSDLSVREVALKTGFSDEKNYIVKFKKATGTTPLKYRMNSIV